MHSCRALHRSPERKRRKTAIYVLQNEGDRYGLLVIFEPFHLSVLISHGCFMKFTCMMRSIPFLGTRFGLEGEALEQFLEVLLLLSAQTGCLAITSFVC